MRFVWLCGLLVALVGCGSNQGGQNVSGTVTLDGAPLAKGTVLFTPIDAKGDAATGQVVNGSYSIPASEGPHPGTHKIEIRALRKSGKKMQKPFAPEGEMVESDEEAIAAEFNSTSKLTVEINPGGNKADFQVTGASH